ncbi:hypothetical protein [Mycobacterium bourgelatii]|uniref:Secreted protein n=1 Tax=Mycobacterium bourgelatii TaxID=1273442 RepID=A0A7I9YUV2_MYCBU|nr:hypothetical protein [Mycobacterium bourgelatii]MCV6974759.1 hypothetical protein [Mycobacterium bourgelatii]GFG92372.1 hypothetical protein MBOU_44140 [Mycobacterium bourgelatii]
MARLRFLLLTAIGLVIASTVAGPAATADPPSPGDPCTVFHATTDDVNGRTLWCNPTMTGDHSLVWQYGGPG